MVGIKISLILQNKKKETLQTTFQINLRPNMGASAEWQK